MKIYTNEQMADAKGKILDMLTLNSKGCVASVLTKQIETQVISPVRINAGLMELSEEGKIKLSPKRRQAPDGGRERVWYLTADCPSYAYDRRKTQHHHEQQFKNCPRCRKDRFEQLEGGGARCQDCGLEQGGLFS